MNITSKISDQQKYPKGTELMDQNGICYHIMENDGNYVKFYVRVTDTVFLAPTENFTENIFKNSIILKCQN